MVMHLKLLVLNVLTNRRTLDFTALVSLSLMGTGTHAQSEVLNLNSGLPATVSHTFQFVLYSQKCV